MHPRWARANDQPRRCATAGSSSFELHPECVGATARGACRRRRSGFGGGRRRCSPGRSEIRSSAGRCIARSSAPAHQRPLFSSRSSSWRSRAASHAVRQQAARGAAMYAACRFLQHPCRAASSCSQLRRSGHRSRLLLAVDASDPAEPERVAQAGEGLRARHRLIGKFQQPWRQASADARRGCRCRRWKHTAAAAG